MPPRVPGIELVSPSSDFIEHVRDALAHLFDIAYLQGHPLLRFLLPHGVDDPRVRAQYLREAILQGIADLRPPIGISPRDPDYRPYAILKHRYVEKLAPETIQDRLAISRRQYFREQQRASEGLAALLWQQRKTDTTQGDYTYQVLDEELEQLGVRPEAFDLVGVVTQAVASVRGLADARGVAITVSKRSAVWAFSDKAIAQQVVVGMLSAVIQQGPSGFLEVQLLEEKGRAVLAIEAPAAEDNIGAIEQGLELPIELIARAGGKIEIASPAGREHLIVRFPAAEQAHVVIVDDNPKAQQLYRRYLEPCRYRITPVLEAAQALAIIRQLQPAAVILDVMMREIDGWQLLQTIRTEPATANVPVIVCSVLREGELARTIGADAYLQKPVSQSALVLALAQVRQDRGTGPA